jgi:hypothetical protein
MATTFGIDEENIGAVFLGNRFIDIDKGSFRTEIDLEDGSWIFSYTASGGRARVAGRFDDLQAVAESVPAPGDSGGYL